MSIVRRVVNIFLAPSATFEELREQWSPRDLWVPLLVLALTGLAAGALLKDLVQEVQLERVETAITNSTRIPEEQKVEIITTQQEKILNPGPGRLAFGWLLTALSNPVRIAFMALVLLLVGNFIFGAELRYPLALSLAGYTYFILLLELLVKVPLMLSRWDLEVYTGLGLLGLGAEGGFIRTFLAGIDFFALWRVILLGIGLGVVTRKSGGPAITALVLVWLGLLALSAGLGAALS